MPLTRERLAGLLQSLAELPDCGEPTDELAHALQAAGQAIAAGADDELVLASAFHDIGRTVEVRALYPALEHEHAAADFLTGTFGERALWLIRKHVGAKRYLVSRGPYGRSLSDRSKVTLQGQGGPMTLREAEAFIAHPWAQDVLALRRWDDGAKIRGAATPSIGEVLSRFHG